MIRIKINKNKHHLPLDAVLNDENLSWGARGMYCYIVNFPDKAKEIWEKYQYNLDFVDLIQKNLIEVIK